MQRLVAGDDVSSDGDGLDDKGDDEVESIDDMDIVDDEDKNSFEVSGVLKVKQDDEAQNFHFLTHWKGFAKKNATWEPTSQFDATFVGQVLYSVFVDGTIPIVNTNK